MPVVLVECAEAIESAGAVDGVYRLSGGAGLTQRLRDAFDAGRPPDLRPAAATDPHAVPSLLKMYFRYAPLVTTHCCTIDTLNNKSRRGPRSHSDRYRTN